MTNVARDELGELLIGKGFVPNWTIYRFYEMIQVYGTTLKSIVHEDFGDGIISAINFKLKVEKQDDPEGGHRCVITLDGKYLPTNGCFRISGSTVQPMYGMISAPRWARQRTRTLARCKTFDVRPPITGAVKSMRILLLAVTQSGVD